MPIENINGTKIFLEDFGSGDPLVLVHGSWVDHMEWPFVVPLLAPRFRVTVYDRRGHSQSERRPEQGSIREDVADLAAIIERGGGPAHVVGNSMGAAISLKLAIERPDLMRTLAPYEPPLVGLLRGDPELGPPTEELIAGFAAVGDTIAAGKSEEGARQFVGGVIGPEAWDTMLPDVAKQTLIKNAPTFLDEIRDPEALDIDTTGLSRLNLPVLLGGGSESPRWFGQVLDKLEALIPNAKRMTVTGAGHIPQVTHPQPYVERLTAFIDGASS